MQKKPNNPETRLALFKGREVRKLIHKKEWWFVIADIISVLTDSVNTSGYINDIRRRDPEISKGWGNLPPPLVKIKVFEPNARNVLNL
jgi:DNA-damage-inducible protein D